MPDCNAQIRFGLLMSLITECVSLTRLTYLQCKHSTVSQRGFKHFKYGQISVFILSTKNILLPKTTIVDLHHMHGRRRRKFKLLTILSALELGSSTMFVRLEIHQTERAELRPSLNLMEMFAQRLQNWTHFNHLNSEFCCFDSLSIKSKKKTNVKQMF